jgi:hypothetical protein
MKAFPRQITFNNGITKGAWIDDGMELRDYFAAKAIPSLVKTFENHITTPADVAKLAYQYADAMMEARKDTL